MLGATTYALMCKIKIRIRSKSAIKKGYLKFDVGRSMFDALPAMPG